MRSWLESMLSAGCVAPFFGARQVAALMAPRHPRESMADVARTLATASQAVDQALGPTLGEVARIGASTPRGLVDVGFSALALDGAGMVKGSIDVVEPLAEAVDRASPRLGFAPDWQELRNKIDIFDLVKNVGRRLGVRKDDDTPLAELVQRSYALGDFHALWAVEGLGHLWAERFLGATSPPRDLLTGPGTESLPAGSLTMLNAGIGLAFAKSLLDALPESSSPEDFARALDAFVELVRTNARPGYLGCAYESLGLVTRTFHAQLLPGVHAAVRARADEELLGYFWHGAGRAIYFSTRNFLPWMRIPWTTVSEEAENDLGRKNVVAGLAWAITLVNMRTPEVLQKLLRDHGEELDPVSFANGVASSIVMRQDTTPDTPFLDAFCSYPAPAASDLWARLVASPCRAAREHYHPTLRRAHELEQVFRAQSLSDLVRWPAMGERH